MRNPFRPIRHFGAALILAATLWSSDASAQESFVAGAFAGTVVGVNDPFGYFGGAFEAGDAVVGGYGYKPSLLSSPPPGGFFYDAGPGASFFTLSVGGIALTHSGPFSLLVKNDTPGEPGVGGPFGDSFGLSANLFPFADAPPDTQPGVNTFSFQFHDPTATALSSVLPPTVIPELSLFGAGQPLFASVLYPFYGPNPGDPTVFDQFLGFSDVFLQVTSHGPAVAEAPEPGSAALLGGALIVLGALRRRRQSRSIAARFV